MNRAARAAARHFPAMQAGTVEAVGAQLLSAVRTSGTPTDEQLSSLHFIYGTNLVKALQIVDQGGVACYVGAGSGRRVYLVHGHAAEHYLVHPDHYCSCQVRRQAARALSAAARGRGGGVAGTTAALKRAACPHRAFPGLLLRRRVQGRGSGLQAPAGSAACGGTRQGPGADRLRPALSTPAAGGLSS